VVSVKIANREKGPQTNRADITDNLHLHELWQKPQFLSTSNFNFPLATLPFLAHGLS
jgi:hypothetical protein